MGPAFVISHSPLPPELKLLFSGALRTSIGGFSYACCSWAFSAVLSRSVFLGVSGGGAFLLDDASLLDFRVLGVAFSSFPLLFHLLCFLPNAFLVLRQLFSVLF